ncbi:hypothetical protein [Nocardioides speluncae]|uniref:hypothetical protein n=1 Tax=Nocardioides speluncae TaxID=2670337 RepID=UPI000D685F0C|nr:hypothetical protein [Nocardioides speluncae]
MMLKFYANSGSTTPATAENVALADDGSFTGWRSIAPTVGFFAGTVPEASLARLRAIIEGVGAATPGPIPPGAVVETIELPNRDPLVVSGVLSGQPLSELTEAARSLLDRMVGYPRAAVGLDGNRLVHRGTEPLELDLATVTVRANFWRGYYEPAGESVEALAGPGSVTAEPGWSLELPVFTVPAGDDITTHLSVDFAIVANGNVIPVQVQHAPDIPEP